MAKRVDVFNLYVRAALHILYQKGYLLHPLDWDTREPDYYIMRIRGADRQPMVGVGSVIYQSDESTITLTDLSTKRKTVFQFEPDNKDNDEDFFRCVLAFAQQLWEEASYPDAHP